MKLRLLLLTFLFSALSWGQTTVSYDFSAGGAVNGLNQAAPGIALDTNVGFGSFRNSGTADPIINSGQLRLYQNATKGGSIMIYASNGVTITQVRVFASGATGPAAFSVDGGASSALTISAGVYTMGSLSSTNNVEFWCTGSSSGTRIYVDSFEVTYTSGASTYNVTYDGNGNDSGSVPVDGNAYNSGDPVTVLGNTGSLGLTGYTFNGWNTAADGSGTPYVTSDVFNITANTTLYAQWLNTSPPVITSSLTASGNVGAAFSYDVIATNSPTSYSATGLPAGLSINTSTGQITGTPTGAGSFNVTITATNAYGTGTETLVITITTGPCHTESMTSLCVSSCTPSTSSYGTRTWSGDGGTWTATDSRSDQTITASNPAITIRSGVITSPSFNDGIASITMTTRLPFADSAGNLTVKVNGVSVGTIPYSSSVQTSTISGINISGNIVINIESTGARVTIDDINWTCFNLNNEIDVQGNGVSIVDGDTTPSTTDDTDFGTTTIGNDISHTFTITNAGPDDLDISGITITGVDAADFYVSINPSSTVGAGGSTIFEVTFSPATAGTSNATINIANNDSDENPYTFDIVAVSTVCTPTTSISSITPTSGPIGTVVTINGSGFTTAASVSFSGVSASFTIVSNTVIEAIVPTITASGNIVIQDAGGCDLSYSSYTLITEDNTSCEGVAVTTDLIIYDLHDEYTGNGGFITIYNGTGSTVDLTNYSIWRTSIYGDGNEIDYADLTGTLASGALGVIRVNVVGCGPAGTNGTIDNGFNGDDQIQLRNAAGTVVIDDVHTYFDKGYYMVRNTGALSARTTFVAADWNTTPLIAGQCWPSAGLVPPSGAGDSPSVTLNPIDVNAGCPSTSATLTVSGSEGVVGGLGLAYQWYVNVPGNAGWTAVSDGGVYSGATTSSLNISSTSGLNNYQYYCQIRENDATCYTATEAAIVKDGATVWNGSVWSNGVPDISKTATINGDYDTAVNGSFSCCSLVVNATYTLDIQAIDYVEIQYNLTNNGTINVWDDGSLVQIDDSGVNIGDINYERITTGVNLDYVYWSSPVDGVNTPATGHVYSWNPTIANPNGGWGYWILSRNTPMASGVGYIMRNVFTRTFTGVPRNGVIQPTIARANYTGGDFTGNNGVTITNKDDNWNLVGNPYPSAISALDFLTANTNIEGAVRIWTHGTSPSTSISDPVYDNYQYNYTVNDYIVYNGTGTVSGPGGFNGFIAGGQSFMINMNDGTAATETVIFNNAMRNKNHNNEQFYKQSGANKSSDTNEKHRIWLDLANAQNNSTRTLVGYVSNASNNKDRMYDAVTNAQSNEMGIYSILNNERMLIQGRTLPFDDQDKVQIAINIPSNGIYSIALSALDGLFSGSQDIYLEDKELNIIHDLRLIPYSFSAEKGEFKDRFVLRYTNQTLNTDNFGEENNLIIATLQNGFNIRSTNQNIKSIIVHNVLGQVIFKKTNINSNEVQVSDLIKNNQALILKVILDNNEEVVKKMIF